MKDEGRGDRQNTSKRNTLKEDEIWREREERKIEHGAEGGGGVK